MQITVGSVAHAHQPVRPLTVHDAERGHNDEKELAVVVDTSQPLRITQLTFGHAGHGAARNPFDLCAVGVEGEFEQG